MSVSHPALTGAFGGLLIGLAEYIIAMGVMRRLVAWLTGQGLAANSVRRHLDAVGVVQADDRDGIAIRAAGVGELVERQRAAGVLAARAAIVSRESPPAGRQ